MITTYDLYSIKDQSITKNNVYVIVDKETKKTALVDPACSMNQIVQLVNRLGLIVDMILITHTHLDHIQCIPDLVRLYSCTVYVSKFEADYYVYHNKRLQVFEDEDIIMLGRTPIRCLVTPGHTVGSSCFLLEKSLFAGDTIFMEGCGICSGYDGSASDMFHSISKIKQKVDDEVLVYSGHTYSTPSGQTLSYLKQNNIYFIIEDEEQFIAFRNRENQKNLYNFI